MNNVKKPWYKKVWVWIIIVLAIGLIAGATNSETETTPSDVDIESKTNNNTSTPNNTNNESKTNNNTSVSTPAPSTNNTKEITVYNENGIKIICKSIDKKSFLGPELKFYIENNSKNNITVVSKDVSVNGYTILGYFNTDIVAGKKANDSITIYNSELEDNNILKITSVELYFIIRDSDTYRTITETSVITIKF